MPLPKKICPILGEIEQLCAKKMVVNAKKLQKLRKLLEVDEDVWCDAVRCAEQITAGMESKLKSLQMREEELRRRRRRG